MRKSKDQFPNLQYFCCQFGKDRAVKEIEITYNNKNIIQDAPNEQNKNICKKMDDRKAYLERQAFDLVEFSGLIKCFFKGMCNAIRVVRMLNIVKQCI